MSGSRDGSKITSVLYLSRREATIMRVDAEFTAIDLFALISALWSSIFFSLLH